MYLADHIEAVLGVGLTHAAHTGLVVILTQDASAQVVGTIYHVTYPCEARLEDILFDYVGWHFYLVGLLHLTAHESLGNTQDVTVTRAAEAVEDTAVAHVDDRVARDGTEEAAAVHELTLRHVLARIGCLRHTGFRTTEVHIAAVLGVFLKELAVEGILAR